MPTPAVAGYTARTGDVPRSPTTLTELDLLKQSVMFGDEDIRCLRMSGEVLGDQIDAVLDTWYGFVGSHPFLLQYFARRSDGQPDEQYLARVRERFGQWIRDTAEGNYDQAWLDYQQLIGRRHHRSGKNRADDVDAAEHIPLRYVIAFIHPITSTLRPFLAAKGHDAEDVERMMDAWRKAVILQVALWSRPYAVEGDF
jgi:Protoglobin